MEQLGLSQFLNEYGIWTGTLLISFISGFIPIINVEVILLLLATSVEKSIILPVIVMATTGQMAARVITYYAGKGVIKLSFKKYQPFIDRIKSKMDRWKSKIHAFLFISAFSGLPPYCAVSLVAGMTRQNFWGFLITGITGRALRFGLMMLFPQIF